MAFKDYFKSNLSYFRPAFSKSDNVKEWITVNGAHVPIREGQSKSEAVREHIEGKESDSRAIKPKHIEKLHKLGAKAKEEIDSLADEIAKEHGAIVAKAPLKKAERIIEKAINDHAGDISKIRDVARNTIVAATEDQVKKIVERLKKEKGIVRYKEHKASEQHGYTGHLFNIETSSGHVAEIQVNTPAMIYAKEHPKDARGILGDELYERIAEKVGVEGGKGHEYYEGIRSAKTKIKALEEKSHKYYEQVRNKSKDLRVD